MHPVKERKWSEADFQFVKDINEAFRRSAERSKVPIPSLEPIAESTQEKHPSSNEAAIKNDVIRGEKRIH
jgi:hypothetical protein